jgi:hypothetical protein
VVTELLTNVVEHAGHRSGPWPSCASEWVHLAVEDEAVGQAPAGPGCAIPGYFSGLRVVNAVALRWGWQQHQKGKTVWAEVSPEASTRRSARGEDRRAARVHPSWIGTPTFR